MESNASGVFNIAGGRRISLNDLASILMEITGIHLQVLYEPPRPGMCETRSPISPAAQDAFGFSPDCTLDEGLRRTVHGSKAVIRKSLQRAFYGPIANYSILVRGLQEPIYPYSTVWVRGSMRMPRLAIPESSRKQGDEDALRAYSDITAEKSHNSAVLNNMAWHSSGRVATRRHWLRSARHSSVTMMTSTPGTTVR